MGGLPATNCSHDNQNRKGNEMKPLLLFRSGFFAAALLAAAAAPGADTEINLVQQSDFKPVIMHGRPSAAFGWYLMDGPRNDSARLLGKYVSGEGCFELTFADGAVTFAYPDPLNPVYTKSKKPIVFSTRVAQPAPPAPKYLTTARVKFDRGKLELPGLHQQISTIILLWKIQ